VAAVVVAVIASKRRRRIYYPRRGAAERAAPGRVRVVNTRIVSESPKAVVVMLHKADVTSRRRRRRRRPRRRLSRKYDLDDGDAEHAADVIAAASADVPDRRSLDRHRPQGTDRPAKRRSAAPNVVFVRQRNGGRPPAGVSSAEGDLAERMASDRHPPPPPPAWH